MANEKPEAPAAPKIDPRTLIINAINALQDAASKTPYPIEYIRLQAQVEVLQAILQNL